MSRLADNVDESGSNFSGPTYKVAKVEVGNSLLRIVDPEGFLRFYEVWPLGDDGKPHRFVVALEDAKGNKDYNILCEMAGDPYPKRWFKGGFFESIKDPISGGQKFIWQDQAPEAYAIMNGDDKNSFKPKLKFAFNCIPRFGEMDENREYHMYCEENNKTQVLITGQMTLNEFSKVSQNNGELDTYDIVINRTGEGRKTEYKVEKADKSKFPKTIIGGLSAAEKAYAQWNLPEELKVSSAKEIYDALKGTIAKIDASAGTNYLEKLESQVRASGELLTDTAPAVATPSVQVPPAVEAPVVQQPVRQVAVQQPVRQVPTPVTAKHICNNCKEPVAEDAQNCPKCGNMVGAPCTSCGTIFSIYEKTCPKCGKA